MGDVTRRDAIKKALIGAAYVAPAIASVAAPAAHVMAASPVAPLVCTYPIVFKEFVFTVDDPLVNTTFDVYATHGFTTPTIFPPPVTSYTTDALGFGISPPFTLSGDSSADFRYLLTFTVRGDPPTRPYATARDSFTGALSCQAGGSPAPARVFPIVVIEPNGATCAGTRPAILGVGGGFDLLNLAPFTTYDVYVQPDNITPTGTFLKCGTVTTNAQGNGGLTGGSFGTYAPQTAAYPTTAVVTVVAANAPPQPAILTATITSSDRLYYATCIGFSAAPRSRAVRRVGGELP